jgi:hypothetical protein
MIIFNHAICKITVHPKSENENREVVTLTKKVGWGWKGIIPYPILERKEFVKRFWSDKIISSVDEYNEKNSYVEDGKVYYYPHCTIHLMDESRKDVYFETVEEMEAYVTELASSAPHIEV